MCVLVFTPILSHGIIFIGLATFFTGAVALIVAPLLSRHFGKEVAWARLVV